MTVAYSDAYRNAALLGPGVGPLLNGGIIKVFNAAQATQILQYQLQATAFAASGTAGLVVVNGAPISGAASATETAADYTVEDSSNVVHITGTNEISLSGGGGSLILSGASLNISSGQNINLISFNLTSFFAIQP